MRPNVFAGPHVDRLKFANADAESVARAIAEGSARLIPVWKSRCPVVRLPSPAACLLPFDSGPFAGIDVNELVLLGEYRGPRDLHDRRSRPRARRRSTMAPSSRTSGSPQRSCRTRRRVLSLTRAR